MSGSARPAPLDRRDAVWLLLLLLLGCWAHWGVVSLGPFGDDYMQHAMVTGQYPGHYAPWDLYAFVDNDPATRAAHLRMGVVPWWTAPDLYGGLLRPVPSLTVWLDHALHPRDTVAHRLHTMAWWCLALLATGVVLRRLFDRPIAYVALAVFAVDHGATLPLSWLANRVMVQTVTCGFFALWLHLRWREDGMRHGAALTCAAMVVTFACGEYALVVAGYVVAYEVLRGRALPPAPSRATWLAALAPTLVPATVYLALHVALGYGTVGSAMYAHPFTDPAGYLHWAVSRVPRLLAELVASTPSETWEFAFRYEWLPGGEGRTGHALLSCGIVAAAAVAAWIVRPALRPTERTALAWLVVGAALGTLPVAAAPAHGRLLLLSHLGGASLVAAILVAGVRLLRARVESAGWARRLAAGTVAATLAWMHGPSDLAYGERTVQRLRILQHGIVYAMGSPGARGIDLQGRDVIVMSSVVLTLVIQAPLVSDYHRLPVPRSWHVLTTNDAPLAVQRTGPRTLVVSYMRGETWLANPQDRLFFPMPRTLPRTTVVEAGVFSAEVLADVDGLPTRVAFTFEHPLEHPRYLFLRKRGLDLIAFDVPAVGKMAMVPLPSRGTPVL